MNLFSDKSWFRVVLVSLIAMMSLAGCSSTRKGYAPVWSSSIESEAFKKHNEGKKSYYVVKPGDTLYSIGFMYKLDYRNLARWNNIVPPYKLEEGDRLRLYTYTPSERKKPNENRKVVTAVIEESGSSYKISKIEQVALARLKRERDQKQPVQTVNREDNTEYTVSETERLALKRLKEQERAKKDNQQAIQAEIKKREVALKVVVVDVPPVKAVEKQVVKTHSSGKNRDSSQKLPRVERRSSQIKPTPEKPKEKVIKSVWQWPISGDMIKNFSQTEKMGIDIAAEAGQKVKASASGKIVYSGPSGNKYGKLLIIKHNDQYISAYAHNDKLFVKEGAVVNQGQVIAEVGEGIGQKKALLHFEIRKEGKSVNPLRYLPKR